MERSPKVLNLLRPQDFGMPCHTAFSGNVKDPLAWLHPIDTHLYKLRRTKIETSTLYDCCVGHSPRFRNAWCSYTTYGATRGEDIRDYDLSHVHWGAAASTHAAMLL